MTKIDPKNCKVALLCGGKSTEREISLKSGEGAREALNDAGYKVTVLDPAKIEDLRRLIDGDFDVAFLCMHGKYGEDGTLQGFLETIGLPYTGSGVWSSSTSINKAKSKMVYKEYGINTPEMIWLKKGEDFEVTSIVERVGEHCVIKAVQGGSTLGLFIAQNKEEVASYIDKAFTFDDEVIIEKFVSGQEFTVPVIGSKEPHVLPIVQIVPKDGFYDFEAKYAPGGSKHLCPAPISDDLTKKMQQIALAAHKALKCEGVSRTDVLVDGDEVCWALETNSLPGMTKTSLLPEAARIDGISFPELCTKLITYALERAEHDEELQKGLSNQNKSI
jgi:D-alanine-D-alanine ligase